MNNRIIKVTKKQPITQAIVFGGTESGVSDIKILLAPAKVNVAYVGRDEWHPMLNSAEQAGEYYYEPFLVLTPHQGKPVRVEKGDIIVFQDASAIKRPFGARVYNFHIYSPSEFGEYYDFIPEVSDIPSNETDEETPIVDPEDDTEVVEETIEEEEEVLISDEQHVDPPVEFDNGAIDGVAGDHPEVSG